MAKETFTATARTVIPVEYRCSKCGTMNPAVITVLRQSSRTLSGFDTWSSKKDKEARVEVHTEASYSLIDRVYELYKKEPIRWAGEIQGKCKICGNVEPWLITPEKYKLKSRLMTMLVIAIVIVCTIAAVIVGDKLNIGIVISIIAGFALSFGVGILVGNIPSKYEKHMEEFVALPEEDKPHYLLTEKEVVEGVKEKLKETLAELE